MSKLYLFVSLVFYMLKVAETALVLCNFSNFQPLNLLK